jgi:hypothetical protein
MRKVSIKPWLLAGGLALGAGPVASAQPATQPASQSLLPDQASHRLRQSPAAAARLAELRSQRAFDYYERTPDKPAQASGAWGRFWQRLFSWLVRQFGWVSSYSYDGFWRWLIYGLLAAAVVYMVVRLLQVDLTWAFSRTPRRAVLAYETLNEDIHELDFPVQLREAEEAGNLRLAVRLGYLALLKQLSDRALIKWQPDKTNQTYLRELASQRPALRPAFAERTRQFEYVWYGELALTPALYAEVRAEQVALGRQLGSQVGSS